MRSVVLLLFGVHLAYARTHSLKYFYTAVSGDIDFAELTAVGLVDEKQFFYFDSNSMKIVPKTEWIKQITDVKADYWDIQNQIMISDHQGYKSMIQTLMKQFNQSKSVYTFMRLYGCEWDGETGEINGIYRDGYNGEDFVSMDYEELRYIASVPQGFYSAQKWNERGNLERWKNYLGSTCVEWLQRYLQHGKSSLEKTVSPQVSLLQKSSSSSVTCHATGFYPSGITITWQRNGQDHYEDVDLEELLPNGDETFQKRSTIKVTPDELKNNEYSCVVEHQGKTIREIVTDKSFPSGIIIGVVVAVLLVVSVIGFVVYRRKKIDDDGSNSS